MADPLGQRGSQTSGRTGPKLESPWRRKQLPPLALLVSGLPALGFSPTLSAPSIPLGEGRLPQHTAPKIPRLMDFWHVCILISDLWERASDGPAHPCVHLLSHRFSHRIRAFPEKRGWMRLSSTLKTEHSAKGGEVQR